MRSFAALALCIATTAVVAAGYPGWRSIGQPLAQRGTATEAGFDAFHRDMVERMRPQFRAEAVLQMAINGYDGATDYAIAKAQSWRDEVEPTATLQAMLDTAMSSPRIEVRMAAVEVALAQSNLGKTPAQVDELIAKLRDNPGEYDAWALWSLGAIGARGVERERIFGELLAATSGADAGGRADAVNALAVFGGAEVVEPLLAVAAGDTDPGVQERAFCGLAHRRRCTSPSAKRRCPACSRSRATARRRCNHMPGATRRCARSAA